jgi:phage anti-repressor protein
MEDIIQVETTTINWEEVQAVSAREIYEYLEMKKDFSFWMKNNIEQGLFVEWEDWLKTTILPQGSFAWKSRSDYILRIDVAKEILLMSRTEKWKEVRRYFIWIEKKYKAIEKRLAEFAKRIENSKDSISMLEFWKVLKVWRNTLFKNLREKWVLMKNNLPYKKYEKYFEVSEKTIKVGDSEKIILTTHVNWLWQTKLSKFF